MAEHDARRSAFRSSAQAPKAPGLFTLFVFAYLDCGVSVYAVHPSWLDVLSDPVRLAVLRWLTEVGGATVAELAEDVHASDRTVQRHLAALVALEIVREAKSKGDGESPGRPPSRFSLDPRARESALALFAVLSEPLGPWPRRSPLPPWDRGKGQG
jgi:DNA-binding transcriptional ArsR family regulator